MVNLWKRYGQKLRSIILLQFELVTFRFRYGRNRKPAISMISRFSDVSLSPEANYFYLWRPRDASINPGKIPTRLKQILFWKIATFRKSCLEIYGKDGHGNIWVNLSKSFMILDDLGSLVHLGKSIS